MFSASVPEAFEREYGSTAAEWNRALPGAAGRHPIELQTGDAAAVYLVDGGRLSLDWQVLPDRQIALVRLPRLQVRFGFEGVEASARSAFMRHFDLFMQRGGG